jgi:hypothetical protein
MTTKPALRVCDECGQVDDGPRHVLDADEGRDDRPGRALLAKVLSAGLDPEVMALAIDQLNEPGLYLHMDCCRGRGCPTGDCDRQTAGAEDLRDGQLREHLMSLRGA